MTENATPSKRVLQIETFGRGGLIHYAFNLSRALAERGHDVTLLSSVGYELEARDVPEQLRVVQATARFSQKARPRWPASSSLARRAEAVLDVFATLSLVRRLRPDVVHLHSTNPIALLYVLVLRLLPTHVVVTAHTVTPHERAKVLDAVYARIHRLAHLVIAHSDFDRRRLLGEQAVAPERVVVIPHGEYGFFDTDGADPARNAARDDFGLGAADAVALFFGYIREYKGLDLLFESWPAVTAASPRARLLVAGDPVRLSRERRRALERWASRLGAVHRFGYIPFADVSRYFAAADVLVMPYRHVSQSGVLFLALSLGVPVVATRVGGLEEILKDGVNALLVPPESPAALGEAIARLLGDAALRERLAAAGRRLAGEHGWDAIAARTELAYGTLVERNRPQP